jgi:hypothetical protein
MLGLGMLAWVGCSSDGTDTGTGRPADAFAAFEAHAATIALELAQDVAPALAEVVAEGVPKSRKPFVRLAGRIGEAADELCDQFRVLASEAGSQPSELLAEAQASAHDEVRDSVVTMLIRRLIEQSDEGQQALAALGVRATAPNGDVVEGAPALSFIGLFDRDFNVVVPAPGTEEYRVYEEWGASASLFRTVELAVGDATQGLDECHG